MALMLMKERKAKLSTEDTLIIVLPGLSQKNESRLKKAGAAFLEKDALEWHNGAAALGVAIDNGMGASIPAKPRRPLTRARVQPDPVPETTLAVEGIERPL
jgi:hypothetical protein